MTNLHIRCTALPALESTDATLSGALRTPDWNDSRDSTCWPLLSGNKGEPRMRTNHGIGIARQNALNHVRPTVLRKLTYLPLAVMSTRTSIG